jgi:MarR-like DNA-binding transcriptional regulator SgrR of sgrS sRNA
MGFLWFGKDVDTWADIGSEKELKSRARDLQLEWDMNIGKKEEASRLYENYRDVAQKPGSSQPRRERAAYEMAQQTKRGRRLDDENNLITKNLETVNTILALKEAERRDKQLSKMLGETKPDKLQDVLMGATKARQEQRDFAAEINRIVKAQPSSLTIEAEKDDDWREAMKDIERHAE